MRNIDKNQVLKIAPDVLFEDLGDELIIMHTKQGHYFGLGAVGKDIWSRLASGFAIGEIVDALAAEYNVERSVLEKDIAEFLECLCERQLVIVPEAG